MKIDIKDKIRGSLIGGAIGDALGYQIEFDTGIKPKQITRFKNNKGIFSDDTQMTLFTACALLWRDTRWNLRGIAALPPEAIYLGYLDWLSTQQRIENHTPISWLVNIPELNVLRDPGITCIDALSAEEPGTLGVPINDSKGCGGIMRLAPIGLDIVGEDNIGTFAAKACALTHGHPLAILSAYTFSLIVYYVSICDFTIEKSIKTAISKMENWVGEGIDRNQKLIKLPYTDEKIELSTLLNQAIKLAKSNSEDQTAIERLGSGWVAEEALAIAIYSSVKYHDNFENAIICAVNHDGDSDSTGAITGNIIGGKLGYEKIPTYYRDNIELSNVILELADDLASGVPLDKNGDLSNQKWLEKYLYASFVL